MMQVQEFIKTNGIDALTLAPYFIKVRAYPNKNVYVLNYDQIESPKTDPIVMECRSLIVDKEGNVLSRSFDRFFNYGEASEEQKNFDLNRSLIYSKEDGSLIKLWYCPETSQWEISTRSQAFAEGNHPMGGTFRSWILKAMRMTEERFQAHMKLHCFSSLTYICEYVGPENRIVTFYKEPKIVCLAVRKNKFPYCNMEIEASGLLGGHMNVVKVKSWNISTYEEIQEACKNLENLGEGVVCYDTVSKIRVKIKSPLYVQIHHLRDNGALSAKQLYLMVLMNETAEYLVHFPEDAQFINPVQFKVDEFKTCLLATWESVKDIVDQKEFAAKVKNIKGSGLFFEAKKTNTTPIQAFAKTDPNRLLKLFDVE